MVSDETNAEENAPYQQSAGRGRERFLTAVALFEDAIDVDAALRSLERGPSSAAQVSLVVRARNVEPDDLTDRSGAVARSLVATALETVGGWLLGLSSLIDQARGIYLIAGPLGAALTAGGTVDPERTPSGPVDVAHALTEFGFGPEEANYLERRIAAGAVLLAVTKIDARSITAIRQLFSDHSAVYIGQGQTDSDAAAGAVVAVSDLMHAAGENDDEPALPPLRRVCRDQGGDDQTCGAAVVDRFGEDAGLVDDLLADDLLAADEDRPAVRYAIVEFGGILGLGRQHVAVPTALVDLTMRPVALAVERKVLHHAPRLAADGILTRRGQLTVCAYFGLRPYWLDGKTGRRGDGETGR